MKINEYVMGMNPPRFTTEQAAALVGKSTDTLRRWRKGKRPVYVPSESHAFGSLTVPLYTRDDIHAMKRIAKNMKPGPQPAQGGHDERSSDQTREGAQRSEQDGAA